MSLNNVSLVCLFMLFCCATLAIFYTPHYMGDCSENTEGLLLMILWFVGVMGGLVLSSSLLLSLVFWEYLGLVSYLLILFYSNGVSLRASMITLFASRFGDVSFFILIMCTHNWGTFPGSPLLPFVFLMIVLSKSACYPFISWLLEAMRAPTPVSSLVHSSTLVAAGVWFFLEYSRYCSPGTMSLLLFFAFISILVSGVCAAAFCDLKKIVALSTCNNVSWCLVFFICGSCDLALLQLLSHGVCKCYLFMVVGDLMSQSFGAQSAVGVYLSRYSGFFGSVFRVVLVLSLAGVPFIGVFFSKHILFSEVSRLFGFGTAGLLLLSLFFSYLYSFRFVFLLAWRGCGLFSGSSSGFLMVPFLSLLGTFVSIGGAMLMAETCMGGEGWSFFVLLFQLWGVYVGYYCFVFFGADGCHWASTVCGGDSLVRLISNVVSRACVLSLLAVYRWEGATSCGWPRVVTSFLVGRSVVFGLNFFVFFLSLLLFFAVLLGVM